MLGDGDTLELGVVGLLHLRVTVSETMPCGSPARTKDVSSGGVIVVGEIIAGVAVIGWLLFRRTSVGPPHLAGSLTHRLAL